MKILYIYPHPDDESFGTAHVMSKQQRDGHEVFLLTLTRGGATRQRHKFGYSIEEMGKIRAREMEEVAKVLDLSGMTVLDLPDSGLKEIDPRGIEAAVRDEIVRLEPEVVVTYAVHGISGFHDHLVSHAIVKSVFVDLREKLTSLRRLALLTVTEEQAEAQKHFRLSSSKPEEIDCLVEVEDSDMEKARRCLDCYVTFKETIEKTGIKDQLPRRVPFEFFQERFDPPATNLFDEASGR